MSRAVIMRYKLSGHLSVSFARRRLLIRTTKCINLVTIQSKVVCLFLPFFYIFFWTVAYSEPFWFFTLYFFSFKSLMFAFKAKFLNIPFQHCSLISIQVSSFICEIQSIMLNGTKLGLFSLWENLIVFNSFCEKPEKWNYIFFPTLRYKIHSQLMERKIKIKKGTFNE